MEQSLDYDIHDALVKACRKNAFYAAVDNQFGPFDGGCVHIAAALQRIYGGEIEVIADYRGRWQHAILHIGGGFYLDGNGVQTEDELIAYWTYDECITGAYIENDIPIDILFDQQDMYDDGYLDPLEAYFRTQLPQIGVPA